AAQPLTARKLLYGILPRGACHLTPFATRFLPPGDAFADGVAPFRAYQWSRDQRTRARSVTLNIESAFCSNTSVSDRVIHANEVGLIHTMGEPSGSEPNRAEPSATRSTDHLRSLG